MDCIEFIEKYCLVNGTHIKLKDYNINSQTMIISVSYNIDNTDNIKIGEKFSNIIQV